MLRRVFAYNSQTVGQRVGHLGPHHALVAPTDTPRPIQRPAGRRPSPCRLLREADRGAALPRRRPAAATAGSDADRPVDGGPQRPVDHSARDTVQNHRARYHVRALPVVRPRHRCGKTSANVSKRSNVLQRKKTRKNKMLEFFFTSDGHITDAAVRSHQSHS